MPAPVPPPPAPPPPAPPPPTIDEARQSREIKDEALRKRTRGRAATILTDQTQGSLLQPETASKTLLG